MKKNRLKIVLLILLTILMIYIWWGNIQSFRQSTPAIQMDQNTLSQSSDSNKKKEIQYRKPKLNPFKKYSNSQSITKSEVQPQKKQIIEPKISTLYILQGIITEKNSSQAIIVDMKGNSSILSINEEINNWTLTKIEKNQIIFKNEKLYDTLWLQTIQ